MKSILTALALILVAVVQLPSAVVGQQEPVPNSAEKQIQTLRNRIAEQDAVIDRLKQQVHKRELAELTLRDHAHDLPRLVAETPELLHILQQKIAETRAEEDKALARIEQHAAEHGDVPLSPGALQAMAERLAEAQIDHRLRELEATALREALQKRLAEEKASTSSVRERRLGLLNELVKQRKLQRDAAAELHRAGRPDTVTRMHEAEFLLQEVMLKLEEERSDEGESVIELNRQIADAAVQAEVSGRLQQLLVEEASRINQLLTSGSKHEALSATKSALTAEVAELRAQIRHLELIQQADALHKQAMQKKIQDAEHQAQRQQREAEANRERARNALEESLRKQAPAKQE